MLNDLYGSSKYSARKKPVGTCDFDPEIQRAWGNCFAFLLMSVMTPSINAQLAQWPSMLINFTKSSSDYFTTCTFVNASNTSHGEAVLNKLQCWRRSAFFPPALAVEGIKSVPSVCVSVCLSALSCVNRWTYGLKIWMTDVPWYYLGWVRMSRS